MSAGPYAGISLALLATAAYNVGLIQEKRALGRMPTLDVRRIPHMVAGLLTDPAWLAEIAAGLPELPAARRERYRAALGLSAYIAAVIVADPAAAELFEATRAADPSLSPKVVANWVTGEFLRLAKAGGGPGRASGTGLAGIISLVEAGTLSRTNAREVFARQFETGESAAAIVEELGLRRISDAHGLRAAVDAVIAANPAAVADYRSGKAQVGGFLVGQVMRETRGQADAVLVRELLRERLGGGEMP